MLTQTPAQLRASVRSFANVGGTTGTLRHPDTEIDDAVLRAIGSFYRKITVAQPDQLALSSNTITTTDGGSVNPLPSDFSSLLSVDITVNGTKTWMTNYENAERPTLTDPSASYTGIPLFYRLRGAQFIEFLPVPKAGYVITLWYIPDAQQPTGGQAFDTLGRLDDYLIAYASRIVATKDKNWDLVGECRQVCGELEAEIAFLARSRDRNSPGRITDTFLAATNRWGRMRRGRRGYS